MCGPELHQLHAGTVQNQYRLLFFVTGSFKPSGLFPPALQK
ncbi:putative transposase domain protein [Escherichia coli 3-475-03_S1_C2]|nr:putative transposase domain protein [Escherichia coli 3-475-03_S1_C2]